MAEDTGRTHVWSVDPFTNSAIRTYAQATDTLRRWTEGRGSDTQHVHLLRGPWGLRLVEVHDVRWTAWKVHDRHDVESTVENLVKRRMLYNLGACMEPVDMLEGD
jgi:hypothetical protein